MNRARYDNETAPIRWIQERASTRVPFHSTVLLLRQRRCVGQSKDPLCSPVATKWNFVEPVCGDKVAPCRTRSRKNDCDIAPPTWVFIGLDSTAVKECEPVEPAAGGVVQVAKSLSPVMASRQSRPRPISSIYRGEYHNAAIRRNQIVAQRGLRPQLNCGTGFQPVGSTGWKPVPQCSSRAGKILKVSSTGVSPVSDHRRDAGATVFRATVFFASCEDSQHSSYKLAQPGRPFR